MWEVKKQEWRFKYCVVLSKMCHIPVFNKEVFSKLQSCMLMSTLKEIRIRKHTKKGT